MSAVLLFVEGVEVNTAQEVSWHGELYGFTALANGGHQKSKVSVGERSGGSLIGSGNGWAGVGPVSGVKSRGSLSCTASMGSGLRNRLR